MPFDLDLTKLSDDDLESVSLLCTNGEYEFFEEFHELSELFEYLGLGIRQEIFDRRLGVASGRPAAFDMIDLIPLAPADEMALERAVRNVFINQYPEFGTALGRWLNIW